MPQAMRRILTQSLMRLRRPRTAISNAIPRLVTARLQQRPWGHCSPLVQDHLEDPARRCKLQPHLPVDPRRPRTLEPNVPSAATRPRLRSTTRSYRELVSTWLRHLCFSAACYTASAREHTGWSQLQEISIVSPASWQYVLQYFSSPEIRHWQAGCAHL